ncbi:MAG: anaerobic ribonucleoside-triphosphate reductase activating protein [Cetobacterium sp.]
MSNYVEINYCDTVNTIDGLAVSLWMSGCPHRCVGCFNEQTWDRACGAILDEKVITDMLKELEKEDYKTFSVLGGEPLASFNIGVVSDIVSRVKFSFPEIKVMIWTGYRLEEILIPDRLLANTDYLIDGKFEIDNPTKKLFRGSDNQRLWMKAKDFLIEGDL